MTTADHGRGETTVVGGLVDVIVCVATATVVSATASAAAATTAVASSIVFGVWL